jgi:hypothetical protein
VTPTFVTAALPRGRFWVSRRRLTTCRPPARCESVGAHRPGSVGGALSPSRGDPSGGARHRGESDERAEGGRPGRRRRQHPSGAAYSPTSTRPRSPSKVVSKTSNLVLGDVLMETEFGIHETDGLKLPLSSPRLTAILSRSPGDWNHAQRRPGRSEERGSGVGPGRAASRDRGGRGS